MTEPKAPAAVTNETTQAVDKPPHSPTPEAGGKKLALLAIVIAVASGLASVGYVTHLNQQQAGSVTSLKIALSLAQQKESAQQQQLTERLTQTQQALQDSQQQLQDTEKDLQGVREKLNSLTGNDSSVWLISQANYLVNLAGRKLWSDQDVTTALALLKSADRSLAQMDDPSVLNVRKAMMQDIATLSNLSQVDYDGVILQLSQLANTVDDLRLADDGEDAAPMEKSEQSLSGSLTEWRHNLANSWHDFINNFISVRRRDNTAQPLLAPNQDIYLRENIRSRLLIASQAVPRHQDEIYQQSLEAVSTWVRAWYNTNDASTKTFLAQLEQLSQTDISMDLPENLSSQPLIDKLMQTRVRGLIGAQSIESAPAATPAQTTDHAQGD